MGQPAARHVQRHVVRHARYGGGAEPPNHAGHDAGAGTSVADLQGPERRHARRALRADRAGADIQPRVGRVVHALTFDGKSPGPELRVTQGDLVEVVARNEDVEDGVTIHWHGIDVPNAEDGVAGVTQDAVLPGASYTYRFRADQVGTFWYHTHQVSSKEVQRGLFGAIVIEPREEQPRGSTSRSSRTRSKGIPTLDGDEGVGTARDPVGTQVRLRLVNTDSFEQRVHASAARRFACSPSTAPTCTSPADSRASHYRSPREVASTSASCMPPDGVRVALEGTGDGIGVRPQRRTGAPREVTPTATFDPLDYGTPCADAVRCHVEPFDRSFELTITKKLGFFDGRPGRHWAINGGIYPDVPMFVVERGDLVARHDRERHERRRTRCTCTGITSSF